MSVLKLATAWNFRDIRKTATRRLQHYAKDDPILRLIVSKQFKVLKWLVPAINALAQRAEPLGREDIHRLELLGDLPSVVLDLVLKIASVRERFTGFQKYHHDAFDNMRAVGKVDVTSAGRAQFDFTPSILEIFDCNYSGRPRIHPQLRAGEVGVPQYESDSDSEVEVEESCCTHWPIAT
jgi:hypothetical protein